MPLANRPSRQSIRRELFADAMAAVNGKNLFPVKEGGKFTGSYRGMLRGERRSLARAYAAKAWATRPRAK